MAEDIEEVKVEENQEEEKTNGRERKRKSGSGTTKARTGKTGRPAGDERGDSGESGGQTGGSEGGTGGDTGTSEDPTAKRKREILERLSAKRNKRNSEPANDPNWTAEDDVSGSKQRSEGIITGDESINRAGTGQTGTDDRAGGQLESDNSNSDSDNTDSGTSGGRKTRIKGVEFEIPKFKPPVNDEKPITKEKQLQAELTVKQSKEMQPRLENALRTLFNGMDKAIELTSKIHSDIKVSIWSSIEESEITIIATAMLETAQKSKLMSTITQNMARDYMLLQLSVIGLPRFIETYKHYAQNGFALGFQK